MESHQFSFGIHIERARILIQRSNNDDAEEEVMFIYFSNKCSLFGQHLIWRKKSIKMAKIL